MTRYRITVPAALHFTLEVEEGKNAADEAYHALMRYGPEYVTTAGIVRMTDAGVSLPGRDEGYPNIVAERDEE